MYNTRCKNSKCSLNIRGEWCLFYRESTFSCKLFISPPLHEERKESKFRIHDQIYDLLYDAPRHGYTISDLKERIPTLSRNRIYGILGLKKFKNLVTKKKIKNNIYYKIKPYETD